jgi:cell division protein FtsL
MNENEIQQEEQRIEKSVSTKEDHSEMKAQTKNTIQKIKEKVQEDDPRPSSTMTLRTILGGDFLTAEMVRHQIWLIILIVIFTIVYVAFRYQCQQDMIAIDKLEKEVLDAKYRALSCSSTLTEKCRESHVLEALKQNKDSLLHVANQPPYLINIPE